MVAPAVAVILGFLTGAGGVQLAPVVAGAAETEAAASIAFADVRAACPLGRPLLDLVALRGGQKHKGLVTLARMNDALCTAVLRPDTPVNQALAVAAVIAAIKDPAAPAAFAPPAPRNQRR